MPFTATGHIRVGDGCVIDSFPPPPASNCPGFDLVGQGFVTVRYVPVGTDFQPKANFRFVAPEPSSLTLLAFGLAAVFIVKRKRR